MELTEFELAYIEAMLWGSTDEDGDSLAVYDHTDIEAQSLAQIRSDCASFLTQASDLLSDSDYTESQSGHDFWFTRNRDGVGFWESDHCDKQQGRALTDIAHTFREVNAFLLEDDTIHVEG
jgi:hypothetical protein